RLTIIDVMNLTGWLLEEEAMRAALVTCAKRSRMDPANLTNAHDLKVIRRVSQNCFSPGQLPRGDYLTQLRRRGYPEQMRKT
ncbi:hypothetical protein FRC09_012293, partial [Ceratobasidium sp. 395]